MFLKCYFQKQCLFFLDGLNLKKALRDLRKNKNRIFTAFLDVGCQEAEGYGDEGKLDSLFQKILGSQLGFENDDREFFLLKTKKICRIRKKNQRNFLGTTRGISSSSDLTTEKKCQKT